MAKRKKTPKGASEATSADKVEGFDDRLARLEALVADLEGGELGLEDAMDRFSEGVKLLGACRGALSAYEERVEELSAEAEAGLSELRGEDLEE